MNRTTLLSIGSHVTVYSMGTLGGVVLSGSLSMGIIWFGLGAFVGAQGLFFLLNHIEQRRFMRDMAALDARMEATQAETAAALARIEGIGMDGAAMRTH